MPGVYVSYPFCQQKCSFCNFASGVSSTEIRHRYHSTLLEEIRGYEWQWMPETLYLGGGTPSLMPPGVLAQIMNSIPGRGLGEATLECAPGTLTREAVRCWRTTGINRVSLGVQSLLSRELRQTGRRHTAETVQRDVGLLREEGISNINLDLIAGLPEQTSQSWEISLDWIERLAPPHVSVYVFETDEESRLGKELLLGGSKYGAAQMPPDDLIADFYERAVSRLEQQGLRRYEISNFSLDGFQSHHNLKYWQLEPYTGFGVDAHSFDGRTRWGNPDTLAEYLDVRRESPQAIVTDQAEEHFFVGLRLMDGIQPTASEWTRFAEPIERWTRAGMLERDGARLRLSSAGVLVSNEIFQEFINAGSPPN
jgi:putative oxygen-independent coproporphyrinogen III oxidase